jgi:hypothetical protein
MRTGWWFGEQIGRPHLAQSAAVTVAHCRLRGVAGLSVWPVSTRDDRNEQDLVHRRIGIRMDKAVISSSVDQSYAVAGRSPVATGTH